MYTERLISSYRYWTQLFVLYIVVQDPLAPSATDLKALAAQHDFV